MQETFKKRQVQKTQQARDGFYLINILVCPKCGEPVFGDAPGHTCGEFKKMMERMREKMHTYPGVWDADYKRMSDLSHEALELSGVGGREAASREIKMEISKRLAEDVKLAIEKLKDLNDESESNSNLTAGMPDPGGKKRQGKSDDADDESEEDVKGCHIEGKIEFGENAPEELRKKAQEVEKMRETINKLEAKQKAREIRKLFEDDLRGPRKLA